MGHGAGECYDHATIVVFSLLMVSLQLRFPDLVDHNHPPKTEEFEKGLTRTAQARALRTGDSKKTTAGHKTDSLDQVDALAELILRVTGGHATQRDSPIPAASSSRHDMSTPAISGRRSSGSRSVLLPAGVESPKAASHSSLQPSSSATSPPSSPIPFVHLPIKTISQRRRKIREPSGTSHVIDLTASSPDNSPIKRRKVIPLEREDSSSSVELLYAGYRPSPSSDVVKHEDVVQPAVPTVPAIPVIPAIPLVPIIRPALSIPVIPPVPFVPSLSPAQRASEQARALMLLSPALSDRSTSPLNISDDDGCHAGSPIAADTGDDDEFAPARPEMFADTAPWRILTALQDLHPADDFLQWVPPIAGDGLFEEVELLEHNALWYEDEYGMPFAMAVAMLEAAKSLVGEDGYGWESEDSEP